MGTGRHWKGGTDAGAGLHVSATSEPLHGAVGSDGVARHHEPGVRERLER